MLTFVQYVEDQKNPVNQKNVTSFSEGHNSPLKTYFPYNQLKHQETTADLG